MAITPSDDPIVRTRPTNPALYVWFVQQMSRFWSAEQPGQTLDLQRWGQLFGLDE